MDTAPENHINYYRIAEAIDYLQKNVQRQPELDEVADHSHLSPFHFQKVFTEWVGISPKRFLQFLTVEFLKERLHHSQNLSTAAEHAGLSSQSRVYDLFTTLEGVTPQEYKSGGNGIVIRYGIQASRFGDCLIGVTDRGVCWLSFVDTQDPNLAVEEMMGHWSGSKFQRDDIIAKEYGSKIFNPAANRQKLHLFVKGTNFQIKVWSALLNLPAGTVTTYQNIASAIQKPKALQAVGAAVGQNHLAYLIPCHRVIRKNGVLGEYRWGATRKKAMMGWEFVSLRKEEIPA
jgi:AraC family transcriptional regulator, regulatory protein of adaptative response / methylated-DNA-[protein]-cysteine methyltransferase